jgi:hypothetical protein
LDDRNPAGFEHPFRANGTECILYHLQYLALSAARKAVLKRIE